MIKRWIARIVSEEVRYERDGLKRAVRSYRRELDARLAVEQRYKKLKNAFDVAIRERDKALARVKELEAQLNQATSEARP